MRKSKYLLDSFKNIPDIVVIILTKQRKRLEEARKVIGDFLPSQKFILK